MTIADVISWKFNDQPGMRCKMVDGTMRIVEFPGGIPDEATQSTWTDEYNAAMLDGSVQLNRAVQDLASTRIMRLLFEINFDQENRLRVLEGKTAITKQTYRTAMATILKDL